VRISCSRTVHPHARGKTTPRQSSRCWMTVHPHARGEDDFLHLLSRASAVHPHARGETREVFDFGAGRRFSPPRTWGRLAVAGVASPTGGSPPRHVGRRASYRRANAPSRFTPARGKTVRGGVPMAIVGSPPRTWGKTVPTVRA